MITSYYSDFELKGLTKVSDCELNELFQEFRKKEGGYFLKEFEIIKKRFFKKSTKVIRYTLLKRITEGECQVINFNQDHSSINTIVDKSYIITFFYGYLNGFNAGFKSGRVF